MDDFNDDTSLIEGDSTVNRFSSVKNVTKSVFSSATNIGFIIIAIVAMISSIIGIISSKEVLKEDDEDEAAAAASAEDGESAQSSSTSSSDRQRHKVFYYMHIALIVIAIATILGILLEGIYNARKSSTSKDESSD